jgi:uncharacterized membrane protein
MNAEKFIRKWGKVRQKGEIRYELTNGIMMGSELFACNIIGKLLHEGKLLDLFVKQYIIMNLICFAIGCMGGVFSFAISWQHNEEKYNQLINGKF